MKHTKPSGLDNRELIHSAQQHQHAHAQHFGNGSQVGEAWGDVPPFPPVDGLGASFDLGSKPLCGYAARRPKLANSVTNVHEPVVTRLVADEQVARRAKRLRGEMSMLDGTANQALGHRISLARKRAGLTQRQLDDELGTVGQVTRWERGINTPSHAALRVISSLGNVRLAWLIADDGPMVEGQVG